MIDMQRDSLILATRRGVGMPLAGTLFWLALCLAAAFLDPSPRQLGLIAFFGTGAVFPLGWWLTRSFGGDLMARQPPLTELGMCMNFVQFAYWPVLILVYLKMPEWTLFTMVVLFSSHFLGYGWLYRSRGYGWIACAGVLAPVLLALSGYGTHALAVALAGLTVYASGVALVLHENRQLPMRTAPVAG